MLHKKVSGGDPPPLLRLTLPSQEVLVLGSVPVAVDVSGLLGCDTVALLLAVQPAASVTVAV